MPGRREFLKAFYAKYAPDQQLSDERLNAIDQKYSDDNLLIKDLYAKYAPKEEVNDERVSAISQKYQLGQKPERKAIPDELQFNPNEDLIQQQDETAIKPIDELKSATRSEMLALNKTSQEFDETGASQALGSFNKAVVSGVAAIPKSVAILAKKLDDFTGVPSKPLEEYSTYQMGDWLDKKAAEVGITATDPTRDGFLNTQVPQALGSVAAIMLTGGRGLAANTGKEVLVNAPKGILGTVKSAVTNPATVSGGLQMAVPEYEAAKAAGMDDDQAFEVFLKNYGVGQTEALPLARAFNRIGKITGGNVVEILKAGGQGGLEEATQELVQTYLSNQIAQGSYDPGRDPLMGMMEAGQTGFFVGFILPGIGAALKKTNPEQRKQISGYINQKLRESATQPGTTTPQTISEPVQQLTEEQVQPAVTQTVQQSADATRPINAEEPAAVLDTNIKQESPNLTLEDQKLNNEETAPQSEPESTLGQYQKINGKWFYKDQDGALQSVIDFSKKPSSDVNQELADLQKVREDILTTAKPKAITQQERNRIKNLERPTVETRVRGYFLDGGKIKWKSDVTDSGFKKKRGVRDETGGKEGERKSLFMIIDEQNGKTVDELANALWENQPEGETNDTEDYRNAIIDIISRGRTTMFEDQRAEADFDFSVVNNEKLNELYQVEDRINQLETEEFAQQELLKQQYNDERRVYTAAAGSQQEISGKTPRTESAQQEPATLIRENGNADKSQQALTDLQSLNLTHVPGLGMGQNQAKGSYVSTEPENRYQTESQKPLKAEVKITNPFVEQEQTVEEVIIEDAIEDEVITQEEVDEYL